MSLIEFLAYLRSLDVQIWVDRDRLRCSAPEGVLTQELHANILDRKPELIAFLTQPATETIPISNVQPIPMSFAQQRLWFLSELMPDNPFYNMPVAMRLQGRIDRVALEQAFQTIVNRHEILRTTFATVDAQPVQIVNSSVRLKFSIVDLRWSSNVEAEVQQRAILEAERLFNLKCDLPLRVTLLQLDDTDHVLLLTLHHIVSDGWSIGVLMHEFKTLYQALIKGESALLPKLTIQYADYAVWQRQRLQSERLANQLNYWQQQLKNLPILDLPGKHSGSTNSTYRGAALPLSLTPALSTALEKLSQREDATLFMVLLAAFQVLLHRYTGQEDIAVGSPIANRNHSQIEPLIGFFVNSLVLRSDLSQNPTFRALLAQVRSTTLTAYAHQDLPFEKLVEALHPERDRNRNPLFQVVFALQNATVEPFELPNLTLKPLSIELTTTRFDLEFHLWEPAPTVGISRICEQSSDAINGFVAYSTERFEQETIDRMIGHFKQLLESICANPDARIADLPMLSNAEQQQLIQLNQTAIEYKPCCIHDVFTTQAIQTPNAIAVVDETQSLTYAELEDRSNQLAHYLQSLKAAPEMRIAIGLERSSEMIVAILGVLKSGAAYVPIELSYPHDRVKFMLQDAQTAILLTQTSLLSLIPETESIVVCLDTAAISECSKAPPVQTANPENLAYVIYTSGSTGTPKGVMICHRSLCNVLVAQRQALQLPLNARVLQFSSFSFDASVFELLMSLGVGGTLYIAPQEARSSLNRLHQFLEQQAIAAMLLPPSVLAQLSDTNLDAVQTIVVGGEACPARMLDRWAAKTRLFNAYGPTETTIWATVARLQPDQPVTIGRPVANTQIYLLDAQGQRVPIGVTGEIYIGGDGLARGYLDRPELTDERFAINALTDQRLYKTGDLARYLPNGDLEFLGRCDQQVKIRGFRIELGEIEARLNQHPAVLESAVAAQDSVNRLIAYIVLDPDYTAKSIDSSLQQQQITEWRSLYDQIYQPDSSAIVGWNSSYTNQPISKQQMREWVDLRVQQILDRQPKRILEIGCGTGLLLFQLAPRCEQYYGTDFSQAAIRFVEDRLGQQPLPQVKLFHQTAEDFDRFESGCVDAVILNSVVQYFPSVDYLIQVLQKAVHTVAAGGFVFIGDVRSLPLLSAFHASVQLQQAESTVTRSQLKARVDQAIFEETELAIDPEFFTALSYSLPEISGVEIQLSRGREHNEMTLFRYNVILQVKGKSGALITQQQAWTPGTTPQSLYQFSNSVSESFVLKNVPNARLQGAIATRDWLNHAADSATVGQLRRSLDRLDLSAIDPESWWSIETEIPYSIEIRPTGDRYDVLFKKHPHHSIAIQPLRSWHTYTNHPLQTQFAHQLVPDLRRYLAQHLPEYMLPAGFMVLQNLPRTVNGKLDVKAIAAQVDRRALSDEVQAKPVVAPQSEVETILVALWSSLLGVQQISRDDHFFELGGHSLLAMQLSARIRDAFGIELPLQQLFETPTIAALAQKIEQLKASAAKPRTPAIVPLPRDAYRVRRSSLMPPEQ